jgi:hypothetical protein
MLQMTLHSTWSSRPRTFQLLGFEVFRVRLQKSPFDRFLTRSEQNLLTRSCSTIKIFLKLIIIIHTNNDQLY